MKVAPVLVILGIVLIGVYCSAEEEELIREKRGRWSAQTPASRRPAKKPVSTHSTARRPSGTSGDRKRTPVRESPKKPDRWQPPRRLNIHEPWEKGLPPPSPTLPKSTRRPGTRWNSPRKQNRPVTPPSRKFTTASRGNPPRKQNTPWERPAKSTTKPPSRTQRPYYPGRQKLPVPIPKDYGTSPIPGKPGRDYPIYYQVPETGFSCANKVPGYYASVKARCQAFYVCIERIPMKSFLCPNGTVFNQKVFTCDWWNRVTCADSPRYYSLNEEIGKLPNPYRRPG